MSYSSPFVYLRVTGHLGTNTSTIVEQWNVGMKIPHSATPITPANLQAFMEAAAPAIETFHQHGNLKAGNTAFLSGLTTALIGDDGKYVGGGTQATQIYTYPTPVAGTGASTQPFSSALVLSLRTQFSRGRASNGRLYWPALAQSIVVGTGLLSTTDMFQVAGAAATMISAINTAAAANLGSSNKVSVMSQVGAGTLAPVTSVRVGCRPDRQERRERSLSETYQSSPVASAADIVDDFMTTPIGRPVQLLPLA